MFSGSEWLIIILLIGVLAVPALIVGAIVLARGSGSTGTQSPPAPISNPTRCGPPAGWFPDPVGRTEQRYWDGAAWTDAVVSNGQAGTDPI